jgi:PEP-CTERM motif
VKQCYFMWVAMLVLLVGGNSLVKADTIGGAGSTCASCADAAYTLTYSGLPISSTNTTQTFRITLDVNDTAYSGGGSFLNAVAIKVASAGNLIDASLFSAPAGFSFMNTGLTANGCTGGGGGYVCAQSSGNGASVSGGPYDFVYDLSVDTGTLLAGTDLASIKALYVDDNGTKVGVLTSENITLQTDPQSDAPEPSSALMLGAGLLGLSLLTRKVRTQV